MLNTAYKGDYVRIHKIILNPDERAEHLPEDTKKVPLEMWVKGFLMHDQAAIGDSVRIETYIGRQVEGRLVEIHPSYQHTYGYHIPELSFIGRQCRALLKGGEDLAREYSRSFDV